MTKKIKSSRDIKVFRKRESQRKAEQISIRESPRPLHEGEPCNRGHRLTPENTYYVENSVGNTKPRCLECRRLYDAQRRSQKP